ncbi:MAG TPA: hypothetical protein VEX11_12990 [Acetobacteraceae bacterium]|nr:hypothetical protein [Acetobacteraceae bacterium]
MLAWSVGALFAIGLGLWIASAHGLDPGNVLAQRYDFVLSHLPSSRRFAELPFLEALSGYPAAPFPLFYMILGALLALGGTVLTLQIVSVGIGLALLWLVYVQARTNRGFPAVGAAALVAAVLISPYFRGTTVYANTDPLPLALLVAAFVLADRPREPRPALALALACVAVWARQFYVFAPTALFLREAFGAGGTRFLRLLLVGAAMAVPVVALVLYWGGPTPPTLAGPGHVAAAGPATTVPVLLSIIGFYALPSAVATLRFHRREFLAAARRPAFLASMACLAAIGVAVGLGLAELGAIGGGGAAMVGLERFGVPAGVRAGILAAACVGVGGYLAYLVLQAPRANAILLLTVLAFVPTTVLYQRYFDPLLPVLFGCLLRTRESESAARSWVILLYPAIELALTVMGYIHYGPLLAARLAAEQQ